jgi:hypothetical protein
MVLNKWDWRLRVKKSHSITLTVVAAMGMAARAQQPSTAPAAPVAPQSCEERRKIAQAAGTPMTETCGHVSSAAHGTSRGGFGATGEGHSGGG